MRVQKTMKNVAFGIFYQVFSAVLLIVTRTVFIKCLGNTYLSVNGLFTNILSMLSLAELGFGEAIVFSMYKPLAESDRQKIKALMGYYKKVYLIVAAVIFVLGIVLMPFLQYLMKDTPNIPESLYVIYFLFLLNSVLSYMWTYKRSIIIADQKNYVVNTVLTASSMILMIVQIVILLITKNFILYLVGNIMVTILTNFYISRVADKEYPYLKNKENFEIDKETKNTISINVKSIVIYKIGNLIVTGMDNIIISSFVGILWVGIYSNYTLIVNKVSAILRGVFDSATASVGNLNALESVDKRKSIMDVFLFVAFWLFGWATIAMFLLVNPFVTVWLGKDYLLSNTILLFILLDFYLLGVNTPASMFRSTMGLFRYGKYRPILSAIVNLIVCFLLVKPFGMLGVVLGTFAARFGVTSWYEPRVVYKYGFGGSSSKYIMKYIKYMVLIIIMCIGLEFVMRFVSVYGFWLEFVLRFLVAAIIPNVVFLSLFFKTDEFIYVKGIAVSLLGKLLKKERKNI